MLAPVIEGMWLHALFHVQIQQQNLAIVNCLSSSTCSCDAKLPTDIAWSYVLVYLQNHRHRLHQFETYLLLFS